MLSRKTFLALLPLLCLSLRLDAFTMKAQLDRDHAELGESMVYRLQLSWVGRLAFQPELRAPDFAGFEARGPQQSSNFQWVNGQVSQVIELSWELVPVKSGTLTIAAASMSSKDPAGGELKAQSKPLQVKITRPKDLFGGASKPPATEPVEPVDETLRDIKPDLGLPWARIAGVALGFSGVLAALVLLARKRGEEVLPKPKGVLERAIGSMDRAEALLQEGQTLPALSLAAQAWQEHARDRLAIGQDGLTLLAAVRMASARMPKDAAEQAREAALSIAVSVFGKRAPELEIAREALISARASILVLEKLTQAPAPKSGPQERKGRPWPKKRKN